MAVGGAALLPGALAGCASEEVAAPVPQLRFDYLKPIYFKVASVNIEQTYKSPMAAPNVEQRFPTSPADAMTGWAQARIKAAGTTGVARFVIEDASVIETKLKKSKGLKGVFTNEPTSRYDGTMKGRLLISDPENGTDGEVQAMVTRSVEVREDATLSEREQTWFDMVEVMIKDFDKEMEKQINAHLSRWAFQT